MRKMPQQYFGADFACLQLPSLQEICVLVEIMPPKAIKKQTNVEAAESEAFVWSDNEVQLFQQVTNEYKVSKTIKYVDWESCQLKYWDIFDA